MATIITIGQFLLLCCSLQGISIQSFSFSSTGVILQTTGRRISILRQKESLCCAAATATLEENQERQGRESCSTDITITLPSYSSFESSSSSSSLVNEECYPSPLHKIHIRSMLSDQEVEMALSIAMDYAERNESFENGPDSDRHVSYATCDFPVDDCDELQAFLESTEFETRIFDKFSKLYGVEPRDLSFDDLFVAYYRAKDGESDRESDRESTNDNDDDTDSNIMDRLELHRDGSLFSFSLLLNPPDEFEGGGTFYDALRDVDVGVVQETSGSDTSSDTPKSILHQGGAIRPTRAGDCVFHCGKILHGADVVTQGKRVVLVGFVDLSKRCVRKGVLSNACKEWGRQDVAQFLQKKQQQRQLQQQRAQQVYNQDRREGSNGYILHKNTKWLSNPTNHCVLKNCFVNFSRGILRRADSERCRTNRLQTEDRLLRTILLLPEERMEIDADLGFTFDEIDIVNGSSSSAIPFLPEQLAME